MHTMDPWSSLNGSQSDRMDHIQTVNLIIPIWITFRQ